MQKDVFLKIFISVLTVISVEMIIDMFSDSFGKKRDLQIILVDIVFAFAILDLILFQCPFMLYVIVCDLLFIVLKILSKDNEKYYDIEIFTLISIIMFFVKMIIVDKHFNIMEPINGELPIIMFLCEIVGAYFIIKLFFLKGINNRFVVSSLFVAILILIATELCYVYKISEQMMTVCTIISLFIVLILLLLYRVINLGYEKDLEKIKFEKQYEIYKNQLDIITNTESSVNKIKHDLNNHLMIMNMMLADKKYEELEEYIKKINTGVIVQSNSINTGNYQIDAILNNKISEASHKGITVNCNIFIPENMAMSDYDIVIVLGNLLDNAIRAVEKNTNDKMIECYMKYQKGMLVIELKNAYFGESITLEDILSDRFTTKENKDEHGYGLKNIYEIVDKYDGNMDITIKNNEFVTSIILYV